MKTVDRRTFLKAAGVSALGLLTVPTLGGCGAPQPFKGDAININDLTHYQLATYEKQGKTSVMYVRYVDSLKWDDKSYYALTFDDDKISEYKIFRVGDHHTNSSSVEENFIAYFGITSLEPAIDSIRSVIGIKEEYTAEDLRETIEEVENDLNKTNEKVLTKQTVL